MQRLIKNDPTRWKTQDVQQIFSQSLCYARRAGLKAGEGVFSLQSKLVTLAKRWGQIFVLTFN